MNVKQNIDFKIKNNTIFKQVPLTLVVANPLFISICKSISIINLPFKWFVDINKLYGTTDNVVCFHKLTSFREKYLRSIEKQLVLNKGKIMKIFFEKRNFFYNITFDIFQYASLIPTLLDLSIQLQVNGQIITSEAIGLSPDYKIKNVKDLENTLILFENTKLCQGTFSTIKCIDIKSTFGSEFVEYGGKWYHSKCINIINTDDYLNG